jgi:centrosomal CEP192-like protein
VSLALIAATSGLLTITNVLAGTGGLPFAASAACGCSIGPLLANSSPTNFGLVTVNTSQEKTVQFTADEEVKIETTIPAPSPSPPFTTKTDGCSGKLLKVSDTCSVTLVFTPTKKGDESGDLTFKYERKSDSQVFVRVVTLNGTGQ